MTYTATIKAGKKTVSWDKARSILIKAYELVGITRCELKLGAYHNGFALGFAHGRKRRDLVGDELYTFCVLACQGCHDGIEYQGKEAMAKHVQDAIDRRAIQPTIKVGGQQIWPLQST